MPRESGAPRQPRPALLQRVARPAHLPVWHAAVPAEVQGPRHGGPGDGGELGVQAGGQAEGQAGPAAEHEVGSTEAQGAQNDEQEPALGETAVRGCGPRSLGLLEVRAGSRPQLSSFQNMSTVHGLR